MNNFYKIFNIILLSILIILYICSITFDAIFLSKPIKIKNITKELLISDIIITIIMIIVYGYLCYSSLYFYSENQAVVYLIIIGIFFITKGVFLLILATFEKIKFINSNLTMVFYSFLSELIFLFINFIFAIFYKFATDKELNKSPLNRVDEFITEDMYRNILTQSLNPDDKDLKLDFEKKFEQRIEIFRNSSSSEN